MAAVRYMKRTLVRSPILSLSPCVFPPLKLSKKMVDFHEILAGGGSMKVGERNV
jgi:hypothetical protein